MKKEERFTIDLDHFRDDIIFTKRGCSFVSYKANGLRDKSRYVFERALASELQVRVFKKNGEIRIGQARRYLRIMDRFRALVLLAIHSTGGQPACGSEITTIRFRNGALQDRNIFIIYG